MESKYHLKSRKRSYFHRAHKIWKRFIEARNEAIVLEKAEYGADMTTVKEIINERNKAFTFNSKIEALITKTSWRKHQARNATQPLLS